MKIKMYKLIEELVSNGIMEGLECIDNNYSGDLSVQYKLTILSASIMNELSEYFDFGDEPSGLLLTEEDE